ncbi:hypothetical protein AAMO2058_000486200 [Amorphochlora amoebiformis]|mmetsp:Transcript_12220/g.19361  ORF Transcript_12220/g.19361 Transcript_12220/m.19361 type:complete len:362 (-) Transcript_12220:273-1358(-)
MDSASRGRLSGLIILFCAVGGALYLFSRTEGYYPRSRVLGRPIRIRGDTRLPILRRVGKRSYGVGWRAGADVSNMQTESSRTSESTDIVWKKSTSQYRELNADDVAAAGKPTPSDFYELLNVNDSANKTSLKKAYRQIFKYCHPDKIGKEANDFCELVNVAYGVLCDEEQRPMYDQELQIFKETEGDSFDGKPKSGWGDCANVTEQRAVFVDELTCIGCRMCNNLAGETFGMEDLWGRARVHTQWGDKEEDIAAAIDSCPVDCIYWVQRKQLPLLEYIMGVCNRISVAAMMTGMKARDSPFSRAEEYLRERRTVRFDSSLNRDTNIIHNTKLQAAIARAWLQLPDNVRSNLWPQYNAFNDS